VVGAAVVSLFGIPAPPGKQGGYMSFKFQQLIPTLAAFMMLAPLVVNAEPVNINTADASALAKALNGVGPAKAKAIVSYREKNGPFKSVDQLSMVDGISQKLIDKNRADIQLGADKSGPAKPAAPAAAPAAKPVPKPAT
jgi:competence protein ComEA